MTLPDNPSCTREHRCGACRRDAQARSQMLYQNRRRAVGPDGLRACPTCGVRRPIAQFATSTRRSRPRYNLNLCRACRTQRAPTFPCVDDCGSTVAGPGQRCRECKKIFEQDRAAKSQAHMRLKHLKRKLERGEVKGLMWIAPDEAWELIYTCRPTHEDKRRGKDGCGKPMLTPGLCWRCARGTERLIVRASEREQPVSPAIPMYVREAVDRGLERTMVAA